MKLENFNNMNPFSLSRKYKNNFFYKKINFLTQYHYNNSQAYRKILNFLNFNKKNKKLSDLPFLPVSVFKNYDLKSIKNRNVFKILTSSGTTGNVPSKIYLDKKNSYNQIKVLNKIIGTVLGKKRLPMLIIDKKISKLNRNIFNAKSAAIRGFSIFGKNHTFLLNDDESINYNDLNNFIIKHQNQHFLIFGFTSQVYNYLINNLNISKIKGNFKNGILLHGGGWKKMQKKNVSNEIFKKELFKKTNLKKIYNYYGLIEQTGSIFIECPYCNCFVTSNYSDIIIRDKQFNVLENNKKGFIQLFSLVPTSYPGHIILTEDIGEIIENDCKCSKRGKRFKVHGRLEASETRGCSDT